MNEWSVGVTMPGRSGVHSFDDDVEAITNGLSDLAPAVAVSSEATTVRVAVEGEAVEDAVARALGRIRAAFASVGWASDVREVEATEWAYFEAMLEVPTFPELVGITEIAELLGTSRQRASELARSAKFPEPLADLAAGPVWPKSTVARFAEEWDRKPGRPRSKTEQQLEQIIAERRADEEART